MGNPHDDYETELPTIQQIVEEQFARMQGQTEDIIADSESLGVVANRIKESLIDEGMNPKYINSLSRRTNAYGVATARRVMAVSNQVTDKIRWQELKVTAQKLRKKLINYGLFAFDGDKTLTEKLEEVVSGKGDLDMISDLLDINELFLANIEKFAPLKKFDATWLETAVSYYNELNNLHATVNNPVDKLTELEIIEKQSYTHLNRATSEIRRWGRLAFMDNIEVLDSLKQRY